MPQRTTSTRKPPDTAVRPAASAATPHPSAEATLSAAFAVPPLPDGFVRRPRLLRLVTEGLRRPLLMVNGPAGAGKSLLVADWIVATAGRRAGVLAWLTVERDDAMPGVFFAHLLQVLRQAGLRLPRALAEPADSDVVGRPLLVHLTSHLAVLGEPVILVVDQFERATGAPIADGLDFLITHSGAGLRTVLITRTDPQLPLHRYHTADRIAEIRGHDLTFLADETGRLVRSQGLALGDDTIRAFTDRTGGWVAGLRLAALAARQRPDPEAYIKQFETAETTIADFMTAEVLAGLSAQAQDLVLRTSILDRVHVDLANTLTGRRDAGRILDELAHANAFVESIGHHWYRHHPLFAQIMRYRLRAADPCLEAELHRSAAGWFHDAGQSMPALSHAALGGDWQVAAEWFVEDLSVGLLFAGLEADRLRSMFTRMPPETPGACPDLIRAALALERHDAVRALPHLTAAQQFLAANPGADPSTRLTCAFLYVLASALTGRADDAHHWAAAFDALEQQMSTGAVKCHPELIGLLRTALGSACLWEGRFDQARRALILAGDSPGPAASATHQEAESRLALVDLLQGPSGPARPRDHARAAILETDRNGLARGNAGIAHLVLARIALEHDEPADARANLQTAAASAAAGHDPIMTTVLAVTRSRLLLAEGDPAGALDALAPARSAVQRAAAAKSASNWARSEVAEAASAALLARGDADAAAAAAAREASHDPSCAVALAQAQLAADADPTALSTVEEMARAEGIAPTVVVRSLLVRARAAHRAGDDDSAVRRLALALDIARPECLRRPFRETGPWVSPLLRAHPNLAEAHDRLMRHGQPQRRPAVPAEPVDDMIIEPLSAREREILERAAEMMSTREIADDLYLSVNTVKTHLKNINRKLCATRRAEAVRRARRLRML